jgi:hypothetical protein
MRALPERRRSHQPARRRRPWIVVIIVAALSVPGNAVERAMLVALVIVGLVVLMRVPDRIESL